MNIQQVTSQLCYLYSMSKKTLNNYHRLMIVVTILLYVKGCLMVVSDEDVFLQKR